MRSALLAIVSVCICQFASDAYADSIARTANSGELKRLWTYRAWDSQCKSLGAKINVLSKPEHGDIVPQVVKTILGQTFNRFGSAGRCAGTLIAGLEVYYKSVEGYRGTDTVTLEIVYGYGRHITDTFTITVE